MTVYNALNTERTTGCIWTEKNYSGHSSNFLQNTIPNNFKNGKNL